MDRERLTCIDSISVFVPWGRQRWCAGVFIPRFLRSMVSPVGAVGYGWFIGSREVV